MTTLVTEVMVDGVDVVAGGRLRRVAVAEELQVTMEGVAGWGRSPR